ncbi:2-succinyl-6-hydroxy-2, 4-cyclohexadiene-1-carboxylate synthase [Thalassocella blandensis]|nr:2-succinyl-6-hydroxy-2, 4-cyclohexadiene-1-carboxylate synthase [Thalassocella blandensis]
MKPTLYLIPGTMCNDKLWQYLHEPLHEFNLVHLPIPEEPSIDAIADTLIQDMVEEEFYLLGFSFGGFLASYIATKIPQRIRHLLIISNSACALSQQEMEERQKNLALVKQYGYRGISRKKVLAMLDGASPKPSIVNTIVQMDADLGVNTLLHHLSVGTQRTDLAEELFQPSLAMTFVFSADDKLVNKTWIDAFVVQSQRQGHQSQKIEVPGCGHMLPLEQPMVIAELIQQLLVDH